MSREPSALPRGPWLCWIIKTFTTFNASSTTEESSMMYWHPPKGELSPLLILKKITFVNGILHPLYEALVEMLSNRDSRLSKSCILDIRKKEVGVERSQKGYPVAVLYTYLSTNAEGNCIWLGK